MRTKLLLTVALFSFSILFSQDKIEYIDFEEINENILEYSEQKDYASIIQQLDRINKNDSIYNSTLLTKSYCLIQLGKFEEVIKVADEGLSDEKSVIRNSFMVNKGLALAELKRYDEAVNVYDEALKDAPKSYLLLYNKAIVLEGLKKYDAAVQLYKESIKINPFYPRSHLRLGNNRSNKLPEVDRHTGINSFKPDLKFKLPE
jgi:tetratricopeptide (TPR) repeat protein